MRSSTVLIDTGALIALLDSADAWHRACSGVLKELRLPFLTSEAVLTEMFHLIPKGRKAETAWKFVRSGGVELSAIQTQDLGAIQELMLKYADRPMDFADATLVHLANRESINTVFTVDHSDFQTYRIRGTRRFRVLPPPRT